MRRIGDKQLLLLVLPLVALYAPAHSFVQLAELGDVGFKRRRLAAAANLVSVEPVEERLQRLHAVAHGKQVDADQAEKQYHIERDKPIEDGALEVVLVDGGGESHKLAPLSVVSAEHIRHGAGRLVASAFVERHLCVLEPYAAYVGGIVARNGLQDVPPASYRSLVGHGQSRKIVGHDGLGILGQPVVGLVVNLVYCREIETESPNRQYDGLQY